MQHSSIFLHLILVLLVLTKNGAEASNSPADAPCWEDGIDGRSTANDAAIIKKITSIENPNCSKPIRITNYQGTIVSPNFPNNYENHAHCIWYIKPRKMEYIRIRFHHFEVEEELATLSNKRSCPFDWLYIFESEPEDEGAKDEGSKPEKSTQWGTFCGDKKPASRLTQAGSSLYLYFHTDSENTFRGFNITYKLLTLQGKMGWEMMDYKLQQELLDDEEDGVHTKKYALQIIAFGITMILFCAIGVAAVLRVFQIYTRRLGENGGPGVYWTSNENSEHQVTLPTPPPAYSDIVKTEEEWRSAVSMLGADNIRMLERRRDADRVQVTYDLSEDLPMSQRAPPSPSFRSRILMRVLEATNYSESQNHQCKNKPSSPQVIQTQEVSIQDDNSNNNSNETVTQESSAIPTNENNSNQ